MYETILLVIFILVAFTLILLIVLQQGSGIDRNISFGNISSNLFLNPVSSDNFITKFTVILGVIFFIISLILGNLNNSEFNILKLSQQNDFILDKTLK